MPGTLRAPSDSFASANHLVYKGYPLRIGETEGAATPARAMCVSNDKEAAEQSEKPSDRPAAMCVWNDNAES
jgi:hypothetical protein